MTLPPTEEGAVSSAHPLTVELPSPAVRMVAEPPPGITPESDPASSSNRDVGMLPWSSLKRRVYGAGPAPALVRRTVVLNPAPSAAWASGVVWMPGAVTVNGTEKSRLPWSNTRARQAPTGLKPKLEGEKFETKQNVPGPPKVVSSTAAPLGASQSVVKVFLLATVATK